MVVRLWEKDQPVSLKNLIATNKRLWESVVLPDTSLLRYDGELDSTYVTDHYATMLLSYGHLYELDHSPNEAAAIYDIAARLAPENDSVKTTWAEFRRKYRSRDAARSRRITAYRSVAG